ncbi:integrin alpha-L-like [Seriola dumerili]|uniref:integrin alpha-L-like n=1 Tax=Seriola dumerili TaxID=41447 RepID=UPI000BBE83F9|nr:integrin alpha-L-like [Seriola dumerili]
MAYAIFIEIPLTDQPIPIKHFRLSIAEDSTLSQFTVCSPNVAHACNENSYPNNVCYKMTDHLQQDSSFTSVSQEWTKQTVDLLFLFDGSGSMTEDEFTKNKDFIVDIMDSLKNSSIKFAAVQFSSDYRKVFDFNDYQAGTALDKLMKEPHMKSLTNTHRALKFVLDDILENPQSGASRDAKKVLVLITDGDPSDVDRNGIIKRYDDKNIIRFVIAVRYARLDIIEAIASQPTEKYVFKIENYNGLKGILEGSSAARAGDITGEMSQSGFSAVFYNVCSSSAVHECHDISYLNSVCYKMTDGLQQVSSSTLDFQEWTKQTVDLLFLFDGSGSIDQDEFTKNKDFIVDIMDSLKNTSIKFAAVQFSSDYRKVFDFNDYQAGTALDKLMKEPHMKSLTNTHRALKFVLDDILENPQSGASRDAKKVLVLITDGDPSDVDRNGIIKRYDDKNIIRFVIAVRYARLDNFEAIASQPTEKYVFKIENYNGLKGILENFQKRIFKMEGSSAARAGDITGEMSQSGFSAVFYNDTLILSSMGSNSWRGSLQKLRQQEETQIEDPHMQNDSYMGYSVSVGRKNDAPLYFTGAPRFEQRGQVIFFRHDCKYWTAAQRLNGEQIGSYFGAELCSVDIDSDGNTDFLLVGAPLFYQPQESREGQIYVYTLTDEMQLRSELNVTVSSMGRFGTTISSLADLNGDGLRDVAVGAPLEDDNRGAVYIYLGDGHKGIRSTFSQRIMGQKIKPGLRFFGQAIAEDIDHGDDGLPRIVIGSQATVIVLRSRPVFNVVAHLSCQPEEISIEKIDCLGNTDENLPVFTLTACFEMVEMTKSKAGPMNSGLNISYTLDVDATKQTHQAFFSPTDEKTRNLAATCELREKETCFNYSIYMPKYVEDTLSPISIRLNFFQVDSENMSAVLNVDSNRQAVVECDLNKNDYCGGVA